VQALQTLYRAIDRLNETVGRGVAWLALLMVLTQFVVVVMRYVFGVGSIWMQESVVYMHGLLFMVGAGYTLLHGGHVRVDVFYREAEPRTKARVDLAGVILFLLPVCALIIIYSWSYVMKAWAVHEGSLETSGIQAVYLLKTVVLAFAVLVGLQGISLAVRSALILMGIERPAGADEHERG
jgi:TRAP-type mannitol/chloroaromatic compound transport system permease small subunit